MISEIQSEDCGGVAGAGGGISGEIPVQAAARRGRGPGVRRERLAALARRSSVGVGAFIASRRRRIHGLAGLRLGLAVRVEDARGRVAVAGKVDDEPVQPVAVGCGGAAGRVRIHHDQRP
jgi:hypothetical protein